MNQVLDIVRDNNLSEKTKKEKLRVYYQQMFDTRELSMRSLGADWRKLDATQQEEFIRLFGQLLENTYLGRIMSYDNQTIKYVRQIMFSDNRARVDTKIITQSAETPINYMMMKVDDTWKIYDVVIENVSLVLNYRSQFRDILATKTPEQMLEILKKKVEG